MNCPVGATRWRLQVIVRLLVPLLLLPCLLALPRGEHPSGLAADLSELFPGEWSSDWYKTPCELPAKSGISAGVCTDDHELLRNNLSFCGSSIRYRACVPAHQPIWPGWDAQKKDQMLARLFKDMVERRLAIESNITPDKYVEIHYLANPDCVAALKNVLCWYNFPKCDDRNQSLPLCQSSCEQYYKICKFEPSKSDGFFDACRDTTWSSKGLFESGAPGPDQTLAGDTEVCRTTKDLVDAMDDPIEEEGPWLLTTMGLTCLILLGLILAIVCSYPQMPPRLREILCDWTKAILYWPVKTWNRLPHLKGMTIIILVTIVLITLTIIGLWGMWREESRVDRFIPNETTTIAAPILNMSNNTTIEELPKGYGWGEGWVPPNATFHFDSNIPLTHGQVRQLLASCTCTGTASRKTSPGVIWVAAVFGAVVNSIRLPFPGLSGLGSVGRRSDE